MCAMRLRFLSMGILQNKNTKSLSHGQGFAAQKRFFPHYSRLSHRLCQCCGQGRFWAKSQRKGFRTVGTARKRRFLITTNHKAAPSALVFENKTVHLLRKK